MQTSWAALLYPPHPIRSWRGEDMAAAALASRPRKEFRAETTPLSPRGEKRVKARTEDAERGREAMDPRQDAVTY
jgi:hypothetical protein